MANETMSWVTYRGVDQVVVEPKEIASGPTLKKWVIADNIEYLTEIFYFDEENTVIL